MNATSKQTAIVELEKIPQRRGSREQVWLARINGVEVGLIRKYRSTRSTTHPYTVFGLDPSPDRSGHLRPLLGHFYAQDGGKEGALARLVVYHDELLDAGRI